MLGFGPHKSASAHGGQLDSLFNITLFFTGIVFILTHIALFWFAYKYKGERGRKALFMPHDNKLEIIWTAIPAVVMCFLVIRGLVAWNEVMGDVDESEDYIEIGATGQQFAWIIRLPGADGVLGEKYFRDISANNPLGQVWTDRKNLDDVVSTASGEVIKLPVNKKVRVRITAKDVLHNFDMPHMRVKMDAVPGIPTYFVFTPTTTTQEYRERLGALDQNGEPLYPEWHEPYDPSDPESKKRYEEFQYELACAELCGKGHYSMRRIFEIVSQEEFDNWAAKQPSYYFSTIRDTDEDPFRNMLFPFEIAEKTKAFQANVETALNSEDEAARQLRLQDVHFRSGSAELTERSTYELQAVANVLKKFPALVVEFAGHTDSDGTEESNMALSTNRATSVYNFIVGKGIDASRLSAVGYGETQFIDTNATAEGKANNRRTEFRILSQGFTLK